MKPRIPRYGRMAAVMLFVLAAPFTAVRADTQIERGSYLVNTIMTCNNCHTPMGPNGPDFSRALSGGQTFDEPPFKVAGSNITPHLETGIGAWSDDEIKQTLRTGVRPNGIPLAPVMPTDFYGIITSSDMDAIVAYLRSVKPVDRQMPAPIYHMAFGHEVFPGSEHPASSPGDTPVTRGFYLATIGHCMECHTPLEKGEHDFANRTGAGGQNFPGPWGVSTSRNITSDPDHGLGRWSDAEIKRAITQGVSRDGSKLEPPMGFGYYAHMTDSDLDAVIAWLRTVPPKG